MDMVRGMVRVWVRVGVRIRIAVMVMVLVRISVRVRVRVRVAVMDMDMVRVCIRVRVKAVRVWESCSVPSDRAAVPKCHPTERPSARPKWPSNACRFVTLA